MIGVFVTIISYKKGAPWPWIKFSLKTLELKITTYKSLKIIKFYFELLHLLLQDSIAATISGSRLSI